MKFFYPEKIRPEHLGVYGSINDEAVKNVVPAQKIINTKRPQKLQGCLVL
jgi:hypothetical protein